MFKGKVKQYKRTQIDQFLATVRSLGNCEMIEQRIHIVMLFLTKKYHMFCVQSVHTAPYKLICGMLFAVVLFLSTYICMATYGPVINTWASIIIYFFMKLYLGIKEGNKHHINL
jgi:hypothetical protein